MINRKFVIPESCISFSGTADYLNEYSRMIMCDTIENIYNIVVESSINNIMNESEDSSGNYSEEIRSSIIKLQEASKKFYEKATEKFIKEIEENKEKYKLDSRMINNVKDNDIFVSIHSFDDLNNIKPSYNCMRFLGQVEKVFTSLSNNNEASNKAFNMLNEEMYKHIAGIEVDSIEDINSNYKNYIIGTIIKIDKNWLNMNLRSLKETVLFGEILEVIKDMNSTEDKIYKFALEMIPKFSNNASSNPNWFSTIGNALLVMHKCNGIIIDAYHRKLIEYKGLVSRLCRHYVNEASEEEQGTGDDDNDKYDATPQELTKNAQQNQSSDPTEDNNSSNDQH